MDQQTLIQFLKKYKNYRIAIENFFKYTGENDSRFQKTFLKGGRFTSYGSAACFLKHISGQEYFAYLRTKSISEISKELLGLPL